jgi:hypothetical protein
MRNFETWEFEEIQDTFGIKRRLSVPLLEEWVNHEYPISQTHAEIIENMRQYAFNYVETWNEDELKFLIISPLVSLIQFGSDKYKIFTQRKLSAKIQDIEVGGIVDFVLSSGLQVPKHPFFFMHEYKQERKRDNDPLGQVLIEMVAAQSKNESNHPLFGTYITGRFWFFVVLIGDEYAVNYALDITRKEDMPRIYKMLQFIKTQIETYLG